MRAVVMHEFGPPGVLVATDAPAPIAGPGEALVAVRFASITFIETMMRSGNVPNPAMLPALPAIPGNGVGGVVTAVGEGVDPGLVGVRVITTTGGSGGYAERVAVPAEGLIAVPGVVELADAVALLADGRTATALMRTGAVAKGETVLVEAAGGGVGSLLVQLARNAGAHVVGVAGSDGKLDLARELGAAVTADYTKAGWAERVRAGAGGVDVVFDGVGGAVAREAFGLLRPGGRFVAFGLASGTFTDVTDEEAAPRGVTVIRGGTRPTPEQTLELSRSALAEAAAGRLRPVIGRRFGLERAADAHAAIEARDTLGKTLLVVGDG